MTDATKQHLTHKLKVKCIAGTPDDNKRKIVVSPAGECTDYKLADGCDDAQIAIVVCTASLSEDRDGRLNFEYEIKDDDDFIGKLLPDGFERTKAYGVQYDEAFGSRCAAGGLRRLFLTLTWIYAKKEGDILKQINESAQHNLVDTTITFGCCMKDPNVVRKYVLHGKCTTVSGIFKAQNMQEHSVQQKVCYELVGRQIDELPLGNAVYGPEFVGWHSMKNVNDGHKPNGNQKGKGKRKGKRTPKTTKPEKTVSKA